MKHKFTSIFGLMVLFLLIPPGAQSRASGEGYSIYLPIVIRQGMWQEVGAGSASGGGISNNLGASNDPVIAISESGTIYVAWEDYSTGNDEIYVRTWIGNTWAEVGPGSASGSGISNEGTSGDPTIAIAPDGTPYIAWRAYYGGSSQIYIRAWNGNAWTEVGTDSASYGGISDNDGESNYPSLAIASDGTLYLAWDDTSNGSHAIYLLSWNGTSWAEVGADSASGSGISNSSGDAERPSLAIGPDGTPYIAWWDDSSGNTEIYIRAWNGNVWAEVGTGSASGGGISNNEGSSHSPSLAIASDGTLYVAWQDYSNGHQVIYIRSWDGNDWVEVGAGSASNDGISPSAGSSRAPSLAIASDGTLYLSWDYDTTGLTPNRDIYVLMWTGISWDEVGLHSASEGGISNTPSGSHDSSVAISSEDVPYVAWYDYSNGNYEEVYIRRYMR